jgi:hypothetical protein
MHNFLNMLCECAKDELVSLTASQQIFQQKLEIPLVQYVLLNSMYIHFNLAQQSIYTSRLQP